MFRIIREINATITMANEIASRAGEEPRWTLFLTNRSFIAQVIATLFAVVGLFGLVLPIEAGDVIEIIAAIGFLTSQAWAAYERFSGKTRAVWNKTQANMAAQEAEAIKNDKLSRALDVAIRGGR